MEIHTIQEYIDTIEKLKNKYTFETATSPLDKQMYYPSFIYRGHGNHSSYQLLPGIFRWKNTSDGRAVAEYSGAEYNIISEFISEAKRYVSDIPEGDVLAWLEIAQHFGVPTRLLDFTQNPLIALYFACESLDSNNGSVWILNEVTYNAIYWGGSYQLAANSKSIVNGIVTTEIIQQNNGPQILPPPYITPYIYRPVYREERMTSQSRVFMLWASDRRQFTTIIPSENYMSLEESTEDPSRGILCHIDIPSDCKRKILTQLDSCGITEKFIYPGLDGIGKFVKKKYSSRIKCE